MQEVSFFVEGTPVPQGSHNAFVIPPADIRRNLQFIASASSDAIARKRFYAAIRATVSHTGQKKLKPWRKQIAAVAQDYMSGIRMQPIEIAAEVHLSFWMPRPKSHFRSGKNSHLLKASSPLYPDCKPDGDKLIRAVLDAITGPVVVDDCQFVDYECNLRYVTAKAPKPGVNVIVRPFKLKDEQRELFDMTEGHDKE